MSALLLRYVVSFEETNRYTIEVEAATEKDAWDKALDMWDDEAPEHSPFYDSGSLQAENVTLVKDLPA